MEERKMALDEFLANGGTVEEFWGKVRPVDEFLNDLADEAHEHIEELTELGAAIRLSSELDGRYVWCPSLKWYGYDDLTGFWQRPAERLLQRDAALTLRTVLKAESKKAIGFGEDYGKAHRKFQKDMQSRAGITNAISFLRTELLGSWEDFDSDMTKLGVGNGVLQLSDGQVRLLEPAPEHKITKGTDVHYRPEAKAPFWEDSLEKFIPDPEVRDFLQRLAGAILVGGGAREQIIPILYGTGATGKSTFIDGLHAAMGSELAAAIDPSTLKKSTSDGSSAAPDKMRLLGARLAYSVESADSVDAEQLKRWSGGEPIVARPLYGDVVEFYPQFTLVLVANAAPTFNERSDGLWRRVAVIGFHQQLPEAERLDKLEVKRRLKEEAEGILAWAVRGYLAYDADGLEIPDQIKAETAEMRKDQDWLSAFLAEKTKQADGGRLATKDLYESFMEWRGRDASIPNMSQRAFNALVKEVWKQDPKVRKVGGKSYKSWEGYTFSDGEMVNELAPAVNEAEDVRKPQSTRSEHKSLRVNEVNDFSKSPREKDMHQESETGRGEVENSLTTVTEPLAQPLTSENSVNEAPNSSVTPTPWTRPQLSFTFVREDNDE